MLLEGCGHAVHWVAGDDPAQMHQLMARTLDTVVEEILAIQRHAREDGETQRPRWPMIVLRTPKGWTGPKTVDGLPTEGTWRSHQVPLSEARTNPGPGPSEGEGSLAPQLPAGGARGRRRRARRRPRRTGAHRGAADEWQPAHKRRAGAW